MKILGPTHNQNEPESVRVPETCPAANLASGSLARMAPSEAEAPNVDMVREFSAEGPSGLPDLGRNQVADLLDHEGKTDGLGYTIDQVKPGRGFSAFEYSHKDMSNGRRVERSTYHPGPFDAAAGLPCDIEERHFVWVGWGHEGSEAKLPPIDLPNGAKWDNCSFDGPVNWYAEFEDGQLAEEYAASLPELPEDGTIPAFGDMDNGGQFRVAARALTSKTTVHDVVLDGRVIASTGTAEAASRIAETFTLHSVVNQASFQSLPASIRRAFVIATNMDRPKFDLTR